jgi:hypothetical protein
MAWQGNGMGVAWERHGMCELAFKRWKHHRQISEYHIFNRYPPASSYRLLLHSIFFKGQILMMFTVQST